MVLHRRERLAARQKQVVDRLAPVAKKARVKLSELWRRDAEAIRRNAVKAEKRAAEALHKGWVWAKPRAVDLERKAAKAARKAAHDGWVAAKPRIRQAEDAIERGFVAFMRSIRPAD